MKFGCLHKETQEEQLIKFLYIISVVILGAWICFCGCASRMTSQSNLKVGDHVSSQPVEQTPPLYFSDATSEAGIHFVHHNGAFGLKMLPEAMGSGVAWIDYNDDNWPDLFLVNGRDWTKNEINAFAHRPWNQAEIAALEKREGKNAPRRRKIPVHKRKIHTGALYRNNKDGTFTDVTKDSGLDVEMYGLGIAVGDYDGDGKSDLYITAYPHGFLFRNMGHGRFRDVTKQTKLADGGFNSSPVWLDYDKDGRLDLFIARYVDWHPQRDVFYSVDGRSKSYSRPRAYKARICHLYRNMGAAPFQKGGARFKDVSMQSGIGQQPSIIFDNKLFPLEGNALGVAVFDWNNDGNLDIAVANDMTPNHLLQNNGNGTFDEVAREAGLALTQQGLVRAGMGIDTADIYNNGYESLLIGNFAEEMLGLWENRGGSLVDVAFQGAIGMASYNFLTFGLSFADLDNDGRMDFITANGHINEEVAPLNPNVTYRQRLQFFLQRQNLFHEVGLLIGADAQKQGTGRGLACADYDLDGDLDFIVANNGSTPLLMRNDSSARYPLFTGINNVVRLDLKGNAPNTDAIGALVKAHCGSDVFKRWVRSGSSYLSQSELSITLGLGKYEMVDKLEISWPSGKKLNLSQLPTNRIIEIEEDKGIVRFRSLKQKITKRTKPQN